MRQLDFLFGSVLIAVSSFQNSVFSQSVPEDRPIVRSYPVNRLPVWKMSKDGKAEFAPSILISAIKAQAASGSWANPAHSIHFEPGQPSLAVFQTPKNQNEVWLLLKRLHAFSEDAVSSELDKSIETGKAKKQRTLIYVGDPDSKITQQIFRAFYSNEGLKVLVSNFILKCTRPSYVMDRNNLFGLPNLGFKEELVVLDSDKEIVVRANLKSISKSGTFDLESFKSFLELHKPRLENAVSELNKAIELASTNDKHVLLQMSGPNCFPCERLKKILDENHRVISKDFVYLKLDRRMPQADEVKKTIGIQSELIPWTAIVSKENKIIQTSEDRNGKNIGFPSSPESIQHFRKMIAAGSGRISEAELNVLMKQLSK